MKTTSEYEIETGTKMVPPFSVGDTVAIAIRRTWDDADICQYKLLVPIKKGLWLASTDEEYVPENSRVLELEESDIIDFTEEMNYNSSRVLETEEHNPFDFDF